MQEVARSNMITRQRFAGLPAKWFGSSSACCGESCASRNSLWTRAGRRDGIRIANKWYCSPECFEPAAEKQIAELCAAPVRPGQGQKSRIPLGLILYSRGVLTKDQLQNVLDRHKESGANVGDAAQQLGFATAEQVTAAVASQWSFPVFPLGDQSVVLPVRIPRVLLELYSILPVHLVEQGRRLLIGFVNGVQYQILYTIEHMTTYTVEPCFITAQDYERQLSLPSPAPRDDEHLFEETMSFTEMARITRSYAVQLGAVQARLGKCRNFVWVRICGGKQDMDLLFRVASD